MVATLKQVAKTVGVSHQTVWRAVHGAPGISEETRAAVLDVAARLQYRRNRIAGSLRTCQSHTIGLVLPEVRRIHAGELAVGVEEAAVTQGYSVLLANTGGDPQREQAAVQMLMERRVDGMVLWPGGFGDQSYLHGMLPPDFPLVAVNRRAAGYECHSIMSRDEDASLAARHLLGQGHQRIAGLFGPVQIAPFRGRLRAFAKTLENSHRSISPEWIMASDNAADAACHATVELFSASVRPTALFAASSLLAEGALRGLKQVGLHHGRDVTLIGYDLRWGTLLDPPLPMLLQPAREMGRLAFDTILRQLREGTSRSRMRRLAVETCDT